jgi:hypothetical protein
MKPHTFLLPISILLAVLFVSYPVNPEPIKPVIVTGTVNVAPAPSEVVSLTSGNFGPCTEELGGASSFKQLFPDGTIASGAFTVPQGKVLVVTSLQYRVSTGIPSLVASAFLWRFGPTAPEGSHIATIVTAQTDAQGVGGGSANIPHGLVVKSGSFLCVEKLSNPVFYAQGFLADDV